MINPISGPNCPDWVESIPPHSEMQFRAVLAMVNRAVHELAKTQIVTATDIRTWHYGVFRQFVPLHYYAGNFRGDPLPGRECLAQNVVVGGIPGTHFPFVTRDVSNLLQQYSQSVTRLEIRWPILTPKERAEFLAILLAEFVGGFIQIHPFLNGNGRLSRYIWRYVFYRFNVPPQCCVHPRPAQPYSTIMSAAMKGDYRPLAAYALAHMSRNPPNQN